jgi:hypothetical protein
MPAERIAFPPHQGLPYDHIPPTVDGFSEWETLPITDTEGGWKGSARVSFGQSSGLHAASMQLLRHASQPYIYLSFLVRFDAEYEPDDCIIIALQDNHSTTAHPAGTRRVLICPSTNSGAGSGTGSDQTVTIPDLDPIAIRTNRDPASIEYAKLNGSAWEALAAPPSGAVVKVRSVAYTPNDLWWSVEVQLPTTKAAGGADWIDLSTTKFGLYCNIISFHHSHSTSVFMGQQHVQFTWPFKDVTGAANVITGSYLGLENIPVVPARMGEASLSASAPGIQFEHATVPGPLYVRIDGGARGFEVDKTLQPPVGGDPRRTRSNKFVAHVRNSSAEPANVRAEFRLARFGIYATDPDPNRHNDGNWELIQPDAAVNPGGQLQNPTPFVSIPATNEQTFEVDWALNEAQANQMAGLDDHQCFAVYLTSNSNAVFAEASTFRNTWFRDLSEAGTSLAVSGRGLGKPTGSGGQHEFIIKNCTIPIVSSQTYDGWYGHDPRDNPDVDYSEGEGGYEAYALKMHSRYHDGENPKWGATAPWLVNGIFRRWYRAQEVATTWIVVTLGYRRTDDVLTIRGKPSTRYELVDSCGSVLTHEGAYALFRQSLEGPGLKRIAKDTYALNVPNGGEVVLQARFEALEPGDLAVLDRLLARIDTLQVAIDEVDDSIGRVDPLHALVHKLVRLVKLLPLPAEQKKVLDGLLQRISGVHQRVNTVHDMRNTVDAIEHHIKALDQIFDKLEAVGEARVNQLLAQLYPADVPRLTLAIKTLHAKVQGLVGLLAVLDDVNVEVDHLDALCDGINLLLASLRGLARTFEKVRAFGAGLEAKFPLLDKLWPDYHPGKGPLGELIDRIKQDAEELGAIPGALDHLAASQRDLQNRENQLDTFDYAELVRVADRIYSEAFG